MMEDDLDYLVLKVGEVREGLIVFAVVGKLVTFAVAAVGS